MEYKKKNLLEIADGIKSDEVMICNFALNQESLVAIIKQDKKYTIFPFNIDYCKDKHLIINTCTSLDKIIGLNSNPNTYNERLDCLTAVANHIANLNINENILGNFHHLYQQDGITYISWDLNNKQKKYTK